LEPARAIATGPNFSYNVPARPCSCTARYSAFQVGVVGVDEPDVASDADLLKCRWSRQACEPEGGTPSTTTT
jgi:hypothetical protein